VAGHTGFPHAADSVNVATTAMSSATRVFMRQHGLLVEVPPAVDLQRVSRIPEAFEFQYTGGASQPGGLDPALLLAPSKPGARFGYLRIRQFNPDGPLAATDELVGEFQRILRDVMNPNAPDGLILDIRGNPGGDVRAAERMLQMLTGVHIQPLQFHLANTPAVQEVLETLQSQARNTAGLTPEQKVRLTDAQAQLQPWIDDVAVSKANGGPLTTGHPLTPEDEANAIGQVYHGPCVLLTDGLTYSAADMFAAGFKDHGIGRILGVDATTGGGGANVWSHDDLLTALPSMPGLPLQPLPPAAPLPPDAPDPRVTMSLAFLRCLRVAGQAGRAIEDDGVEADLWAPYGSAEDLLDSFPATVIGLACELMAAPKNFSMEILSSTFGETAVDVVLQTTGLDWLGFDLDGVTALSSPAKPGVPQSFSVPVPANAQALHIDGCFTYTGPYGTNCAHQRRCLWRAAQAGSA
jgi:Peptidase family S41